MLGGLAWRNVWRQRHRTVLSLASIALASALTIFILAMQLGTYGGMKENVLRLIDGFAQVQPPHYADDPDLRKTIDAPDALLQALAQVPAVTASAPRASSYVILSNGPHSYGAAMIGVDPAREVRVSSLSGSVSQGRYLQAGDGGVVVVGAALARNLKLQVGDKVTMLGTARDGSIAADVLSVVGVFSTGASDLDRQVVEMPLARFQGDFALGQRVNAVAIVGPRLGAIQAALPRLRGIAAAQGLVLRDWTRLEPALDDVILLDMSFSSLLYVSLIAVVVFIILNTLLMSVLERTHEFGMLMAIGMRPTQIGAMVWLELLFLAGGGMLLGVALGAGLTGWVIESGGIAFPAAEALFKQWNMPSVLVPQLDWLTVLAGPLAIALCIAVAGFVPYLRVLRLEPVSAMRAM